MDKDDYVDRFKHMDIPSNITRISETNFDNLKQLSDFIMGCIRTSFSRHYHYRQPDGTFDGEFDREGC